jgi:DNA-binding PadR family transcriptional regulator
VYELIILSLLTRLPMHGYLIVKVTNDLIGPWARISSGSLSTILNGLEEKGLIVTLPRERETSTRGTRRSRTFTITEEGRKRFHQLMMDTSSNLGEYQKFFHRKLEYFDLLRPNERLLLVNHYINYCQATILHLQTERESLVHELADHPTPAFLQNVVRVMTHVEQQWQAELEWVRDIREQELALIETPSM